MKRALLVLVGLLAAYLAAALVVTATAPASPLEEAVDGRGHDVRRAAVTLVPAIRQDAADVLVLAAPGRVPDAEQRALLRFAESGGVVVVAGAEPDALGLLAPGVRVHPGVVYGGDGGPPRLAQGDDLLPGARSLDLEGSGFGALARTEARTFRDSDGDGALGLGEPAGPFVVAAARDVGAGRVVLLAVEDPGTLGFAPGLLDAALGAQATRVALAEPRPAWAAPALLLVHASALAAASLVAAAAVLLAAGGVLAWLMSPRADTEAQARSVMERLLHDYQSSLARRSDAAAGARVPPGDEKA